MPNSYKINHIIKNFDSFVNSTASNSKKAAENYWNQLEARAFSPRNKFAANPATQQTLDAAKKVLKNVPELKSKYLSKIEEIPGSDVPKTTTPAVIKAYEDILDETEGYGIVSNERAELQRQVDELRKSFYADKPSTANEPRTLLQYIAPQAERDTAKPKPVSYVSPDVIKRFQQLHNELCFKGLGTMPIYESSTTDKDTIVAANQDKVSLKSKGFLKYTDVSWNRLNQALEEFKASLSKPATPSAPSAPEDNRSMSEKYPALFRNTPDPFTKNYPSPSPNPRRTDIDESQF